ncbi:MAG: hypothetical protein IJX30_01695 [Clostridia bacterium]|nr:hypothetical protein [Clostridia bacterium]
MKKKFLSVALTAAMAIGGVSAIALEPATAYVAQAETTAQNPLIGQEHELFKTVANAKNYYGEDGYAVISNLQGWGTRSYYTEKVKFDGLSVSFWMETNPRDAVGFYFGNNVMEDFITGLTVTNWNDLYSGQNRLHFSNTHDYNKDSVVYQEPECTNTGFKVAASHVSTTADKLGYTVSFESYDDSVYKVTVKMLYSTMWGNNANYNSTDKTSTVYLPKSTVAPLLDSNGDTYIFIYGFPSGTNPYPAANVKLEDDYIRAYNETLVAPAQTAVQAYADSVLSIETEEDYNQTMVLRENAQGLVAGLKAWEKAGLELAITQADEELANNEQVVTVIKNIVLDKVTAAKNAFNGFANEDTLTEEAYAAAVSLADLAKAEYANRKSMLDQDASEEVETAIAEVDYLAQYYKALQWIVSYEKVVGALDANASTIGDDLKAAEAMKNAYAGSEAQTLIQTLKSEDKAALEGRITAANDSLIDIKTTAIVAVKDAYIAAVEKALEVDISVYANIAYAFKQLEILRDNVTVEAGDGELYTRYTAVVEDLNTALEGYLIPAIEEVQSAIDAGCVTLASYSSVKTKYDAITLALLNDGCANKAAIEAAYAKATDAVQNHAWAGFSTTGVGLAERNDMGLYFEMTAAFPNRINYDKALNMVEGINMEIELTMAAYYNGEISPEGKSKGANNLCLNFLSQPGQYKAMGSGMSVIIWLYANNASVSVVNSNDVTVANGQIITPMDGGSLKISLKHETVVSETTGEEVEAYVLTVNETCIVLEKSVAEANRMEISDECYFSLGAFADYTADPNCFTIVSVNDKNFTLPVAEPDAPVAPETPDEPDVPTDSGNGEVSSDSEKEEKDGGCGGVIGMAAALPALAGIALVWKKRKDESDQ